MKWGMFFLLPLFYANCLAGTLEEYQTISSKYENFDTVMKERETHIVIHILDKTKNVVACEFRTYEGIPLLFFEKVDGVMGCVWKHPEVEKQEKKVLKNREVKNGKENPKDKETFPTPLKS